VSVLRKFLGLSGPPPDRATGDTQSVRRIASRLDELDSGEARRIAAFAYVLARVARADLDVDSHERQEMGRIVSALSGLSEERAAWVVEIACAQSADVGGTDDYLVTRDFRDQSNREERIRLLECVFAVAASDGSISTTESETALAIAQELGFSRREGLGLRARWRDHLAVLQQTPR
jgi:uncharacterized tellurite resistance protein B-like protein